MEWRRYGYATRSRGPTIVKPSNEGEGSRQFGTEIPRNILNNQIQRNAVNHARKRKFHEVNEDIEQKEKEESFERPAKKFRYNLRSRKERTESTESMPIRAAKKMDVDSEGSCDEDIDLIGHANKKPQPPQYQKKKMIKQAPIRRSMRLKNKRIRKMQLERMRAIPQIIVKLPPKPKEPEYILEAEGLECDVNKQFDDLFVTEYITEIMEWYQEVEESSTGQLIKPNYISSNFQPDLNESMRCILLNWLYNVHRRFKLLDKTLFLGIYIFDAYLSQAKINRNQLQLMGCASMWIASKYHEIYAPEANDFAYISDHSFNLEQIFKAELSILCELKFKFADIITPLQFMQRYLQIAVYPICKKYKDRGTEKALADGAKYVDLVTHLTSYFCELALFDCGVVSNHNPSKIAAASLCFAILSISLYPQWPDFLKRYTKYDYDALRPLLVRLNDLMKLTSNQFKSVRKKHPSINKWLDRLNIDAVINNKYHK